MFDPGTTMDVLTRSPGATGPESPFEKLVVELEWAILNEALPPPGEINPWTATESPWRCCGGGRRSPAAGTDSPQVENCAAATPLA